jgi:ComF family protein
MWVFDGVARKIIHELKYKSGEYMLLDIERMVSQNKSFIELISSSVLVPVPIHWRRLFYRGYNQSELIAKMLCKITKNSTVRNLLIKKKHNRSQTELSSDNRVRNVAGSFALCKKIDLPKHVKIVIVDDVMTTGATVNECVKQFNEEGYYNLFVATLARD